MEVRETGMHEKIAVKCNIFGICGHLDYKGAHGQAN